MKPLDAFDTLAERHRPELVAYLKAGSSEFEIGYTSEDGNLWVFLPRPANAD